MVANTTLREEDSIKLRAALPVPVAEISTVTAVADVAGSLTDTYFILNTPENSYYVWIRVDGAGNDPEPYAFGERRIIVDIVTGQLINDVAAAIQAAIDASTQFTATVLLAAVTVTNLIEGAVVEGAEEGGAGFETGFGFAEDTPGVDANDMVVNCKFINTAAEGSVISVVSGSPNRQTYNISNGEYDVVDSNYQDLVVFTKDV